MPGVSERGVLADHHAVLSEKAPTERFPQTNTGAVTPNYLGAPATCGVPAFSQKNAPGGHPR